MKAPRRSPRSLFSPSLIEQLESRQLLAATLTGDVLTVAGTNNADNIRIKSAGNSIVVRLNNTTKTFTRSAVKQLVVNGNAGNDKINVTGPIPSVVLNGGSGNDHILGSGGGDLIMGGDGKDFINGRKGDDQIYGEGGDDVLHGAAGNDTIGGDDEDLLFSATATHPAAQVGTDKLFGEAGDDWLLSGSESDDNGDVHGITDLSGNDQLSGGSGNDILDIRGRDSSGFEVGAGDTIVQRDPGDIVPIEDVTDGTVDYSRHIHAFIKISINSQQMVIPDWAGEFDGKPVAHTHQAPPHQTPPQPDDVRGMEIHFHNTGGARPFTLQEFMRNWGISLSNNNIGRFRVDAHHTLKMTVNGVETPINGYVIHTPDNDADANRDKIVITYA